MVRAWILLVIAFQFGMAQQVLPSWNNGPARQNIIKFVTDVTQKGGRDYLALPKRVAVFDNDGTLWQEKPAYVQVAFILDSVKKAGKECY